MLKISILAFDNCQLTGLAGFLDLFTLANWEWRRLHPGKKELFCRCEVVTQTGKPVTSFSRLPIEAKRSLDDCQDADLIILPGIMGRLEPLLENKPLCKWLQQQHQRGAKIASACSGAFILAETGLLKGRKATTHWQLADRFRQRYPKVKLEIDRLLIDGRDYFCAGGTSAHFDLALYLLEKFGSPALAAACAKMMLLERRPDQGPYLQFRGDKKHSDQPILKVQRWLDSNYRGKVVVKELAAMSGLNERTFLRRFRKRTGEAPLEYVQRMRIEKAKQLLSAGTEPLEAITKAVGYADVSSFRRLFKQIVGMSPTVYRQRFRR